MTNLHSGQENCKKESCPRILCIVDSPNWILARHVSTLQRLLCNDFIIDLGLRGETYNEEQYDLIYPLEFNMIDPIQIKNPLKYATGIRSFVAWADWDFLVLINYLVTHFKKIHVVSRQLFDLFSPYILDLQFVTHGVDTSLFKPSHLTTGKVSTLRLGWAGNRKTYVKGFLEFIKPLGDLPGVELVHVGYADRNFSLEEMPGFYESLDGYVCGSSFEGSNNSILEAAAMERAIITTPNGTVPEFLTHKKNALIVDRDLAQFQRAVELLRDNLELRSSLGNQARKSLLAHGWDWGKKAEDYRQFFWDALASSPTPLSERILTDVPSTGHYTQVLKTQMTLLRDLRIGTANDCLELQQKNAELEYARKELEYARHELDGLKKTRFYKLYAWLTSMKIIKLFLRR